MPPLAERAARANEASDNNPYAEAWNDNSDAFEEQFDDSTDVANTYDSEDTAFEGLEVNQPVTERASSRLANLLRNGADKADAFSETFPDLKEKAKSKLRGIGSAALSRMKNGGLTAIGLGVMAGEAGMRGVKRAGDVIGDATISGLKSVENGLDKAGQAYDTAKENRQTRQFDRQMERDRNKSAKEYLRQTEQLEKDRARQEKVFEKQDRRDAKQAARDLKDYTKILDKKDRQDARRERKDIATTRRAERRARWSANLNALKSTGASGIDMVKNSPKRAGDAMINGFASLEKGMDRAGNAMISAKESLSDAAERTRKKARVARIAGKMALNTYRDTKEAFKNN